MAIRSARNVEKQKKKNRRALPRKKLTRIQGNTLAVRRRLKKMAGKKKRMSRMVLLPVQPRPLTLPPLRQREMAGVRRPRRGKKRAQRQMTKLFPPARPRAGWHES